MIYKGKVRVTIFYKNGVREVEEFDNLITDAGLNFLRDLYLGDITDGEIKYIAIGTGEGAPANADTTLGSEQFRKPVTLKQEDGTGRAETISYIHAGEANFHIKELGWFAGADAGDSTDSGVLIARVLYDHNKNELEALQIDRVDEFERSS